MTVDRDRAYCQMNLYKKVPGKTVSEKKPGNKNFGKKIRIFSSPWKKNVTGIKSCVLDSWDYFS